MSLKIITVLVVLGTTSIAGFIPDEGLVRRYEVEGLAGDSVYLPCEVDTAMCGDFHSIKWYKGNDRVFIFSDTANLRKAMEPLDDRTDFHYVLNGTNSSLAIFPLRTEDEGLYKCEITYLVVKEKECSTVQFVNLTTYALPTYLSLSFEDGSSIDNGTTIGPFDEATTLTVVCESGFGKPVARVTWWNGTQALAGDYSGILEHDGSGLGRNILRLPLTRDELGTTLKCEAENIAMKSPFMAYVDVDVNVPPLGVRVSGADEAALDGDTVVLTCVADGARPPATITWKNGSLPVEDAPTVVNVQEDTKEIRLPNDTYETQSRLQFKATRFENGQSFSCEASNTVLENRNQEPMTGVITLDVHYAPVVRVNPENITVNESMDVLIFCQYTANPAKLSHVYWYQDGRQVNVAGDQDKYGNGNVDHPSLLIKNSSSSDMGEYTCRVANKVAASEVINSAFVSVQYRPQVQVIMDPVDPVSEDERVNVTLICDVSRANPDYLIRVRWYLDGQLLKELPECDGNATLYENDSELCDIDPSRLLLENVFRDFHGNYSCEGMNDAGWGTRSNEAELIVHYPPGQADITYQPPMVVKGQSLELNCNIEDAGRPAATSFRWYRGSRLIPDETSASWIIDPVSLETEANFTCVPVNTEGEGTTSTVQIDVLAAPIFIERLTPYKGALMNSRDLSLSCRVECSPLCAVNWYKDDLPLDNDTHYVVTTSVMEPDSSFGDLESVNSVVTWQMDRWPGGMLDRDQDNSNFTCTSSSNMAGPGVTSHTYFRVEYPPEEIIVSDTRVQVIEGEVPPKIECRASSYPVATYVWQHGEDTVSTGAVLNLDYPIERERAGDYECRAQNKHGEITSTTTFDVLFKPECKIDRLDGGSGEDAHILLICRAAANPEEVIFRWRMLNETLTQYVSSEGLESRLRLPASVSSLGTYYCYVNNTIGEGIPCEIDVTGVAGIMEQIGNEDIIITLAIIAGVIILVIIICIVIIVLCRRQRQAGKYPEAPKPAPTGPKDNGVSSPPDDDKQTFYENLPFHGMQPPPNKNRKTANYGSAPHQNPTPSSSSSSSSPSSYPYQPQYQPHYQRNPSTLYKQYPSSSSLNQQPPSYHSTSSRQLYSSSTYPHPVESQSHPATSYPNSKSHPATSYPSNQSHPATSYPQQPVNSQSHLPKYTPGVVYADLTLSRNGHPNTYRRDLNTEYAILQFNGPIVGQEIDV